MTYTTNYNLKKPEGTDPVLVEDLNDNADIIDSALGTKQDTLIAGDNITIDGNTISATGGGGGSLPTGNNKGDVLEWNGAAWVPKPRWQILLQPCEYIQNSGGSHILTDIIPQSGDILTIDFQLSAVTGNPVFAGCANAESGSTNRFLVGHQGSGEGYNYQCADQNWRNTAVSADTDRHTIAFDSSGTITLDGDPILTFTPSWGNVNYPLGIFAKYYGAFANNDSVHMQGKLYGASLTRDGLYVAKFTPCYNIITGDIGLWDEVRNKFYGNTGSGSFTKGTDV